jgi:threonine dehydrogenase-like Zn-dependent dehydrogenase
MFKSNYFLTPIKSEPYKKIMDLLYGTGKVELLEIEYPKLALGDRKCEHGVILKIIATNICGSDQHMVRGRTTAEKVSIRT